MGLMTRPFIISSCLNSVRVGVVSGDEGKLSRFMKCVARAISSVEREKNYISNEGNVEHFNGLDLPEDGDSDGIPGVSHVPPYVKLSDSDILISQAMMSVKSKKSQRSGNEILLEGNRLIADAIKFGAVPKTVFFSQREDVAKIRWPKNNFQLYKIAYKTIKRWSSLTTSPGIMGIFEKPQITVKEEDQETMPLLIVCDNIRDPGNLGSILRVAAGVGCKCVLLTKGCVELWEPKVLRSGAGAHFVLPVHSDCSWNSISTKFLDDYSSIVLADNSSSMDTDERPISIRNDIPWEKYLNVDYSGAWNDGSDVVLILGGETAGLSPEACELACSRGGVRLNIPLHNEIESLNASTALGIITYEIRRQFDNWSKETESLQSKSSS